MGDVLLGTERGTTRSHRVKIHTAIWPLVDALRLVARPIAARRPTEPVPPAIQQQASVLLAATRRVLGEEPGMGNLFVLPEPADWITLLTQLEFAMAGFTAYRKRYLEHDDQWGLVWRDETWLRFRRNRREFPNDGDELSDF